MQLMPGTASVLGVQNSFEPGTEHRRRGPAPPGAHGPFGNNLPLATRRHNAGERAVLSHRGIRVSRDAGLRDEVLRYYDASTLGSSTPVYRLVAATHGHVHEHPARAGVSRAPHRRSFDSSLRRRCPRAEPGKTTVSVDLTTAPPAVPRRAPSHARARREHTAWRRRDWAPERQVQRRQQHADVGLETHEDDVVGARGAQAIGEASAPQQEKRVFTSGAVSPRSCRSRQRGASPFDTVR